LEKEIKPFYFFNTIGDYSGILACSLSEFLEAIKKVNIESIEFHLYRDDFQKWITDMDQKKLVTELNKIKKSKIKEEKLRTKIIDTVSTFLKKEKKKK
jgi:mRNA degradation ribonuclease J1/J2